MSHLSSLLFIQVLIDQSFYKIVRELSRSLAVVRSFSNGSRFFSTGLYFGRVASLELSLVF